MAQIFEPIMYSALIYIDDILLLSKDEWAHKVLLAQFHQIVHQYGIMLSENKSQIRHNQVEFLGMQIS